MSTRMWAVDIPEGFSWIKITYQFSVINEMY
jgi:hypothetical protein